MDWSSSPTTQTFPGGPTRSLISSYCAARGVLELVHQEVAEPLVVLRADLGVFLQQLEREHDEVVEVHGVVESGGSSGTP